MSLYPPGFGLPAIPTAPPGLEAIYCACKRTYPDQSNPLQVTALVKYWLGGPDPLDYISMYSNPGDPARQIPPHWHYVSFGLSDLHGDGRVHDLQQQQQQQNSDGVPTSGFGFELTFRLQKDASETSPPTWPAALMQALARYVFQSENILCCGDHVSWHAPLDGSDSRLQHMLMAEDPQLGSINAPFGKVTFIQIVGVCLEELQASQQWNGLGVLDLMRETPSAGGPWLLTDMRRGETIFEVNPGLRDKVEDGIVSEGSNLSGVSARCAWEEGAESDWDDDDDEDDDEDAAARENGESRPIVKASSPSKKTNVIKNNIKDASPRQQQQSRRPPSNHLQHDSDPNEDIEDSDEYDDEDEDDDDDVPLGAEGVFPESDSEDERNDSIRRRLLPTSNDTSPSHGNTTRNHNKSDAESSSPSKKSQQQQPPPKTKDANSPTKGGRSPTSNAGGGKSSSKSSANVNGSNAGGGSSQSSNNASNNGVKAKERLSSANSQQHISGRCSSKASKCSSRMDTESCGGSSTAGAKAELAPGDRFLETGVHLKFNLEAGTLLLLAFRGRLRHGRHFTFKSVLGDVAITFVTPNIVGALCTEEHPYAAHGPWLQVLLMEHMLNDIQKDLEDSLSDPKNPPSLPKTFRWPENRLSITVVSEEM